MEIEQMAKALLIFGPPLGGIYIMYELLPRMDDVLLGATIGILGGVLSAAFLVGPLMYYQIKDRQADAQSYIEMMGKRKGPKVRVR